MPAADRTAAHVTRRPAAGKLLLMTTSPYLFTAADHPLRAAGDRLKIREAVSGFGIALRYQERAPDPPGAAESAWCETGHSIFILSGRIRYRFDDHTIEAGPGDMIHIPAGRQHRHIPNVVGTETVRYVLTEFATC
ncbi:MAG: cupin domain-containing protein [Acetobacteraceae bacterium]|jgi:hypothetical protein